MNVMIVTAMYPPIRTGSSHYAHDLAHALHDKGDRVVVVTLRNREAGPDAAPYPIYRLPAIHVPYIRFFKHFRAASFYAGNYLRAARIAKRHEVDVILLVNHYQDIAFIAVAAARAADRPLLVTINTQIQSTNPAKERILNFFDRLICGRMIFPFCRKIISLDTYIHQYLDDVHGPRATRKSVLIPYGVNGDPNVFLGHNHDYGLHHQMLGVGAVIEQRNFIFALHVFKRIVERHSQFRFKIIGHVYYEPTLTVVRQLGIEDKVIFTGEMPHDKVMEEIKKSDLYAGVFSGKYPGLGTATIETMLMGVPVISNARPDLFGDSAAPTALADMESYIHADVRYGMKNVDGVLDRTAAKIKTFLERKDLRERIGQGGRRFVQKYLDWSDIAGKMGDLFQRVTSVKGRG